MTRDRTESPGEQSIPERRADADRVYRLTRVGLALRATPSKAADDHLIRILHVIEGDTHVDVIRGWLRHYTDAQLDGWLEQLEAEGFVVVVPRAKPAAAEFAGEFPLVPRYESVLTDTEVMRLDTSALYAGAALRAHGAFINDERVRNLPALDKPPTEIALLIVEDDPDLAALAERRMQLVGYQVRVAHTHRAFIESLRDHGAPQVVLLDVDLPDGNGFDILTYIRCHPQLSLLPVIMLTARNEESDIRKGLELGADGYIPKPYAKSVLIDTVRQVLKHR